MFLLLWANVVGFGHQGSKEGQEDDDCYIIAVQHNPPDLTLRMKRLIMAEKAQVYIYIYIYP